MTNNHEDHFETNSLIIPTQTASFYVRESETQIPGTTPRVPLSFRDGGTRGSLSWTKAIFMIFARNFSQQVWVFMQRAARDKKPGLLNLFNRYIFTFFR
jgi:hypothetical protein